ncbi:MAG: M48 family metallopeptidase [Rhodospirillales bacterium]|nr:M48 family metallopeptidase [Alphaproteobacteria bacterium]MCB9981019.1 M48 family metallopeptidase [Rhodospirillales bacterium]
MSVRGRYFDGRQSTGFDVEIDVDDAHLFIRFSDGKETLWPLKQISVLQEPLPPLDGVLVCRACDAHARLVLSDKQDWRIVTRYFKPYKIIPDFARHGSWSSVFFLGAITALAITAFVMFSPILIEWAVFLLPQSYMEKLEQDAVKQFSKWPECNAPEGTHAMETLIRPLVEVAELPSYSLRVLKGRKISNAMVLPGGHIIVFQGLVEEIDTAAELSGVLAHEIAHTKLRHIEKSIVRDTGISLLLPLMFGGTDISQGAIQMGDFLQRMKYSREDELEADALGYRLLVDAGLPPEGIQTFFEKRSHSEETENGVEKILGFARTHPYSKKRVNALEALNISAANFAGKSALSREQWEDIKNICKHQLNSN